MLLTLLCESVCVSLPLGDIGWACYHGPRSMGLDAGLLRAAVQRLFQQRRGENRQNQSCQSI